MAIGVQSGLAIGFGGNAVKYSFGAYPYTFGSSTSTQQQAQQERDNYGAANQDWLLKYDNNSDNVIQLLFTDASGIPIREIQNRTTSTWVDVINTALTPDEFAQHDIQELKNVPDLQTGKLLRVGQDGNTHWTNEAVFTGSNPNLIYDVGDSGTAALLFNGTEYTSTDATSVGNVLTVDLEAIDTDISKLDDRLPFTTYSSYTDLLNAVIARGSDINLIPLGTNSLPDSDIRGINMQAVLLAMYDNEKVFWTVGSSDYTNVFPIGYSVGIITRLSSSRCIATVESKVGSKMYDFSEDSASDTGLWKKRVQYEIDGNIQLGTSQLLTDGNTLPTQSGMAGIKFAADTLSLEANQAVDITTNDKTVTVGRTTIDLDGRIIENVDGIALDSGSVYSSDNPNQSINFFSSGAMSIGVNSGESLEFGYGGNVKQKLNSSELDMSNTQVKDLKDATDAQDATSLAQVETILSTALTDITAPDNAGIGQLMDEAVDSTGYGYNRTITYLEPPTTGKVDNMDTDYSLIWAITELVGENVYFLMLHKDFVKQKVNTPSSTLNNTMSIGVAIQSGKGALGEANQTADTGCIWDYSGRMITDTKGANSTASSGYIDEDGNSTNDRDKAKKATYTSSSIRNVEDIVFTRGYVYWYGSNSFPATFQEDNTSPWFIGRVSIGSTFNVNKLWMLFQTDCHNPYSIQEYYDEIGDIIGGNIQSNTDNIELLDERVTELETTPLDGSTPDANGVIEYARADNLFMKGLSFDHNTLRGGVSHGFDVSGVIDSDGLKHKGVSIVEPSELEFSITDNVTTSINLDRSASIKYLDLFIHISTASKDSWMRAKIFKMGGGHTVSIGRVEGEEFTQLGLVYNSSLSNSTGKHCIDVVGGGSGESMDISVRIENTFNK